MAASVGIVLSTYNGAPYVEELLESLAAQTRQPDAVYIWDDASTDDTPDRVAAFIAEKGLGDRWTLVRGQENRGWRTNFKRALLVAETDLVFLCDQDDVWDPGKVESMSAILEGDPSLDVLACDVEPLYESGAHGKVRTRQAGAPGVQRVPADLRIVSVGRPGCTYAVRRDFVQEARDYWPEDLAHDGILWRLSALKGTLGIIDEPLVRFRRHESTSTPADNWTRAKRLRGVQSIDHFFDLAGAYNETLPDPERNRALLPQLKEWSGARADLLTGSNRVRALWRLVGLRDCYDVPAGLALDAVLSVVDGEVLSRFQRYFAA